MRPETKRIREHLKGIDWFANCGTYKGEGHVRVKSKGQALKSLTSVKWNRFITPIINRYGELVLPHFKSVEEYNAIAMEVCGDATDRIMEIMEHFIDHRLGADPKIKSAIRMDVSRILWETEVACLARPLYFLPLILPVYELGHLPCGWQGKMVPTEWSGNGPEDLPDGKLRVF